MRYMGYPAVAADTRYASYYPIWSQMDLIGMSAVTQAPVEAILAELVTVDAAIAASGTTASTSGALKKVDELEWYNTSGSSAAGGGALSRGRMLVKRLAQRMGGEHLIAADYFGSSLSPLTSDFALG